MPVFCCKKRFFHAPARGIMANFKKSSAAKPKQKATFADRPSPLPTYFFNRQKNDVRWILDAESQDACGHVPCRQRRNGDIFRKHHAAIDGELCRRKVRHFLGELMAEA